MRSQCSRRQREEMVDAVGAWDLSVDHLGQERWVVELRGEHDLSHVRDLHESLEAIFAQGTLVVIDLSATTFIDSSIFGRARSGAAPRGSGFWRAVGDRRARRRLRGAAVWPGRRVGHAAAGIRVAGGCAALVRGCDVTFERVTPSGRRIPDDVRQRILDLQAKGMSRNGIAELFNRQAVPTAAGGRRWYASTIQRVTDPGK